MRLSGAGTWLVRHISELRYVIGITVFGVTIIVLRSWMS